jgi:signal transduction histidine kinase
VDLPEEIPVKYTVQDVAVFSRGYLADYPVFVWGMDNGLLVLGYPKDSYTKLLSNYYSAAALHRLPVFVTIILVVDLLLFFLAYTLSKRKILTSTEPIVNSIKTLSDGKPINLAVRGELSEVAEGLNTVSQKLNRQNEARANWISGVSHDIRTPLSMILGYADRIANDEAVNAPVREQADIIRRQSVTIKELVQDLNLVSQLEYEMQPLQKKPVRIARLLRSHTAELLNAGISDKYTTDMGIPKDAEQLKIECDERLIARALSNLFQNSMKHNPDGCTIKLALTYTDTTICISVADNGVGISEEKLRELNANTHYMESADDKLNLRHGLGLLIVKQIVNAHNGTITIESAEGNGFGVSMVFQRLQV